MIELPAEGERREPQQEYMRDMVFSFLAQRAGKNQEGATVLKSDYDLLAEFLSYVKTLPELTGENISFDLPRLTPTKDANPS
ncbi:hypothetical protein KW797_00020 [Candidatus Parcubacteria bacterium]|nr:hypothetical protein [Candidatus Parcubacteria bacterium]